MNATCINRKMTTFLTRTVKFVALAGLLTLSLTSAQANRFRDRSDHFLRMKVAASFRPLTTSVIVQFEGRLTVRQEMQMRRLGAQIVRRLPVINAMALRVPTESLERLADLPFISRLSEDVPVKKNDEFTVGSSLADVAFQQYGLTGSNITVAVLDTGIRQQLDLTNATGASRILANVSFVPNTPSADDACSHGTHVAGIIAGNAASSTGSGTTRHFYGIARNVNLVNVRVLDANGVGDASAVIAGIDWCITNKNTYNIRVMNLSLGHPVGESYATDPLCQAVERAWRAGIVVVVAAGNKGRQYDTVYPGRDNEGYGTAYGTIYSPGNDPYVITVGAMKQDSTNPSSRAANRIATYSSRGPSAVDYILKPDIVAPGNRIISTRAAGSGWDLTYSANLVPLTDYWTTPPMGATSQYYKLSGTSMATPVVSGAVALMLQANPNLTPDIVKVRLMTSADPWLLPNGTSDPCTFGAGYLNIPAALNSTATASGYALSATCFLHSDGMWYVNYTSTISVLAAIPGQLPVTPQPDSKILWGEGDAGLMAESLTTYLFGDND